MTCWGAKSQMLRYYSNCYTTPLPSTPSGSILGDRVNANNIIPQPQQTDVKMCVSNLQGRYFISFFRGSPS